MNMYKSLDRPISITEHKWEEGVDAFVYVQVLTYNHESYIRDCIDGILIQKTTFPVHIVVFEDCSTDNTARILKEYQDKYPNLFTLYLQPTNTFGKEIRREALKPWYDTASKGKYIAKCEGDDYWTDPLKLQKQVDFLEVNPDYAFCFHKAEVVIELDNIYQNFNVTLETREYTGEEILRRWAVPTASVVYRNYDYRSIPTDKRFLYGDIILFLWLAEKGKIYCINESMSVYRRHEGGVVLKEKIPYQKTIAHYTAINEHFGKKYNKVLRQLKAGVLARTLFFEKNSIRESFNILAYIITRPKLIYSFCRNLYHLIRKSL